MDNNVVVPSIPARIDGRFVSKEDILPPEVRYPKFRELMRLKKAADEARNNYIAMRNEGEAITSEYNDMKNQYEWWENEEKRLESLPPHPARDQRLFYAQKAARGSKVEMFRLFRLKTSQDTKIDDSAEASFKARADYEEYVINLCK
jgi:hypothetical protein